MNLQQQKDNQIPTVRLTTDDKSAVEKNSAQEMTRLSSTVCQNNASKSDGNFKSFKD